MLKACTILEGVTAVSPADSTNCQIIYRQQTGSLLTIKLCQNMNNDMQAYLYQWE